MRSAVRASGSCSHDLYKLSIGTLVRGGKQGLAHDEDVGGGGAGADSWIGEKPYFPEEAAFRCGDRPRSDSPLGLPLGRPLRNGLSV